jgi:hypothetical protein
MPFQSPRSLCKQLLARGTLTITLVGSLALYHQTASIDRVALDHRSWRADVSNNLIANRNLYCGNKIIISTPDSLDREEQGGKIRRCWLNFFRSNKI